MTLAAVASRADGRSDEQMILSYEYLPAGAFVYIHHDGVEPTIRLASAAALASRATGYVLQSWAQGVNALIYTHGVNDRVTGTLPERRYYLSTTPGQVTLTPPTTPGSIIQLLGNTALTDAIPFHPQLMCVNK